MTDPNTASRGGHPPLDEHHMQLRVGGFLRTPDLSIRERNLVAAFELDVPEPLQHGPGTIYEGIIGDDLTRLWVAPDRRLVDLATGALVWAVGDPDIHFDELTVYPWPPQ